MHHPGCLPGPPTPLPGREEAWSAGAPAGSGPNPIHLVPHTSVPHPQSHQPACSLAGGEKTIESSFAGSEARTPCSLASRNVVRCWTGRGHHATSHRAAVAIPALVSGSRGGARWVSAAPKSPCWRRASPRGGARQSKGFTMVSPRTARPNSLFRPLPPLASCLF